MNRSFRFLIPLNIFQLVAIGSFVLLAAGCQSVANPQTPAEVVTAAGTPSLSIGCAAGSRLEKIDSGGQIREYQIHIPPTYRMDQPVALVLGFHGNGGTAGMFEEYSGLSALADREGFIMVYPQGMGEIPTWEINAVTDNRDVQFVHDLIAGVAARCAVDPDRIYATGHSRGGGMANRLACDLSDRIAAIGPVSGVYPPETGDCVPPHPVAIIAFHGDADPVVPYNGIGNQNSPPGAYFTFGIPIPQWASAWASRNGCSSGPVSILDETRLAGSAWNGCRNDADVVLYTIPGGGHGWPGGEDSSSGGFNAAQMIWDFFAVHSAG